MEPQNPMIGVLGHILGEEEQKLIKYYAGAIGKTIAKANLHQDEGLKLTFEDGTSLHISDQGQSCCEYRHVTCDDDLNDLVGKQFLTIQVKDGPDIEDGECHETMFVEVTMHDGTNIVMTTHNEHNGYYGGFDITISYYGAIQ